MIGNIRAFNDEILRKRRRELGHLPVPEAASATAIKAALTEGDLSRVRIPYVGRDRIKGFRLVGAEVFADTSGFGQEGEPALTLKQLLLHMLKETETHGTLFWGLTEVGQFQGYVRAWKAKGA